jgi:hypothetical protein
MAGPAGTLLPADHEECRRHTSAWGMPTFLAVRPIDYDEKPREEFPGMQDLPASWRGKEVTTGVASQNEQMLFLFVLLRARHGPCRPGAVHVTFSCLT